VCQAVLAQARQTFWLKRDGARRRGQFLEMPLWRGRILFETLLTMTAALKLRRELMRVRSGRGVVAPTVIRVYLLIVGVCPRWSAAFVIMVVAPLGRVLDLLYGAARIGAIPRSRAVRASVVFVGKGSRGQQEGPWRRDCRPRVVRKSHALRPPGKSWARSEWHMA